MTHYLYRLFDGDGVLLYVGESKDPWQRWARGHRFTSGFAPRVARGQISVFPDRLTALKAERDAIVSEQPLFNVKHNTERPATPKVRRPPKSPAHDAEPVNLDPAAKAKSAASVEEQRRQVLEGGWKTATWGLKPRGCAVYIPADQFVHVAAVLGSTVERVAEFVQGEHDLSTVEMFALMDALHLAPAAVVRRTDNR